MLALLLVYQASVQSVMHLAIVWMLGSQYALMNERKWERTQCHNNKHPRLARARGPCMTQSCLGADVAMPWIHL